MSASGMDLESQNVQVGTFCQPIPVHAIHPLNKMLTNQSCAKDQAKAGDDKRKSLLVCPEDVYSLQTCKCTHAIPVCEVNACGLRGEFFSCRLRKGGLTGIVALQRKLEG